MLNCWILMFFLSNDQKLKAENCVLFLLFWRRNLGTCKSSAVEPFEGSCWILWGFMYQWCPRTTLLFLTYTLGSSNIAGWKMGAPDWVEVVPIKNGAIPASFFGLSAGSGCVKLECIERVNSCNHYTRFSYLPLILRKHGESLMLCL